MDYLAPILSVSLVSAFSLIGVLFLFFGQKRLKKVSFILVSLAVGSMFGDVAWHLLPEAFEVDGHSVPFALVSGILVFFVLEKVLHWQHEHEPGHSHTVGRMSIAGDAMHNLLDGILIGSTFIINPTIGFATTIAVILHEIPQEIADFGILIHAGFSKQKALMFNLLSALTAFVGLVISFWLGATITNFTPIMLAFTAGGFIYIAGSDLIPELHRDPESGNSIFELSAIVAGLLLMFLLTFLE